MKKEFLFILLLISLMASAAPTKKQLTLLKKDIITVKASVKSGKDLDKSEATVRKYLSDSLYHAQEKELQQLLCDVLKKAYEVGNEKMYLKVVIDTTYLIKTDMRMFLAYQRMDSLDASNRNRNSAYILPYRTNIFMGGLYFLHKKDWKNAWDCFDIYLQCPRQPLFSHDNLTEDDSLSCKVAFLSLVAATHMNNLSYALKYADRSVKIHHKERALRRLSEISINHQDTVLFEKYLRDGFSVAPLSDYFYPNLVDLLCEKGRYDEALDICDKAVAIDSLNTMFLLGKHGVLMDLQRYDEAIITGEKLISINDSLDTPYYDLGLIYYHKAQNAMNVQGKSYRMRVANAQKYYRKCRPYIERYRQLAPYDKKHWHPILYDVYFNLNMGKEFAEIEKS